MRPYLFLMCLMLAALLCGCSTKWQNPNVGDDAQAKVQLRKDSDECSLKAGEEYPLDKRRQGEVYNQCMEEKGWSQRDWEIGFGKR